MDCPFSSFFAQLSSMVIASQQQRTVDFDFKKQFPSFLWLFRDSVLPLPLDENGVQLTLTEYIKSHVLFSEAPSSKPTTAEGVINALLHLFPSFECCKLPFPSTDPEILCEITSHESELSTRFNEGVAQLRSSILSDIEPKRSLTSGDQQFMNGSLLAMFVETCTNSLKSSNIIPELSCGWQAAMTSRLETLLNTLVSDYVNEMDQNKCGRIAMEESIPDSFDQCSEDDSGIQVFKTESDIPISADPSNQSSHSTRPRGRLSSTRSSISLVISPISVTRQRTLIGIHQSILDSKLRKFRREINRCMGAVSEEKKTDFLTRLEQRIVQYDKTRDGNCTRRVIGGALLKYIQQNHKKSAQRCNQTLDHILEPLKSNLTREVDSIRERYYSLAVGPAKDEVFAARMREFEEIASRLPPGPPRNLRAVGMAQTKVKIKWKRSNVHLRATKGYEVQIMLGVKQHRRSEWKSLVEFTTKRAAVVTDLSPSTTYLFRVRGKNTNQIGEWSEELEVSTRMSQASRYRASAAGFVGGSVTAPFVLTAKTFKEGLQVYRESDSATTKLQAGVGMVVGSLMLPIIMVSESLLTTTTGIENAESVYESTGTTSEDDLDERKAEVVSILPQTSDISSSSSSSNSNSREATIESRQAIAEQHDPQQMDEEVFQNEAFAMESDNRSSDGATSARNTFDTTNRERHCRHYQLNTEPDHSIETSSMNSHSEIHSTAITSSQSDTHSTAITSSQTDTHSTAITSSRSARPSSLSLDPGTGGEIPGDSLSNDDRTKTEQRCRPDLDVHGQPQVTKSPQCYSPSEDSLSIVHSFAFPSADNHA